LEDFKAAFESYVEQHIASEQKQPTLRYDAVVGFKELNPKLLRIINQMAPFGPKNMRPVFVTHACKDAGGSRVVGVDQSHLKLEVIDSSGMTFHGIGFGLGHHLLAVKKQTPFSILYTLEENHFNGVKSLQIRIKDLKFD
jgi:single-stranded-DNA-specific exonuclease